MLKNLIAIVVTIAALAVISAIGYFVVLLGWILAIAALIALVVIIIRAAMEESTEDPDEHKNKGP